MENKFGKELSIKLQLLPFISADDLESVSLEDVQALADRHIVILSRTEDNEISLRGFDDIKAAEEWMEDSYGEGGWYVDAVFVDGKAKKFAIRTMAKIEVE